MQIEILDGAVNHHAVEAWRLSRDVNGQYKCSDISAVDAPVNEMPSAFLHFKDFTILEREIFFTSRQHVAWARTSRVDDPLAFTVPKGLERECHSHYKEQMLQARANGQPQDIWRKYLPLAAHTSWTARMSVRDLIKWARYFEYLENYGLAWSGRFADVRREIVRVLGAMSFDGFYAYQDWPLHKFLQEHYVSPLRATMHFGNLYFATSTAPIMLRAQLVRHRDLKIDDNFFQAVIRQPRPEEVQLNFLIELNLCATFDEWRSILTNRTCWIADPNLWPAFIRRVALAQIPLPCADGTCPFAADASARLTPHADPNPPCPRYMNLNNIDKAPWRDAMMTEAGKRGGIWPMEALK